MASLANPIDLSLFVLEIPIIWEITLHILAHKKNFSFKLILIKFIIKLINSETP